MKPAFIQVCLLSYWALHWEPLRSRLMALLWLIPAAMLVDLLLVRRLHRTTRLSTAAIPVTFSAMLYTNYPLEQSYWMGLVVLVALLSKALIRRRGKHVFNPSTLGLTLLGYLTLLGVAPLQDVAHAFSAPPNMVELILILALIAQLSVPIVLVTVGAVCGLGAWALVQGATGLIPGGSGMLFTPGWAPVTLVLVLLLTDPATIPRSPAGRALFGLICGAVMGLWGDTLIALGHPDFFGKVMAVPFTNALVPWIERWGRRLDERLTWLQPRLNRAHVAVWVVLGVLLLMVDGKGSHFSSNMHVHMSARPPLLKVGADGVPGCAENPIYCAPFSLGEELRCWGAKFGLGTQCADLEPFQAYAMAPYLRSHWSEQRQGRRPIPP